MNLLQQVCKILDFQEKDASVAINEARNKNKLKNTWMKVNNHHLLYVKEFDFTSNKILTDKDISVFVEDLDVFLPEAGLYTDGKTCVYLKKHPKKQWQKSFNTILYSWTILEHSPSYVLDNVPAFIHTAKRVPFFKSKSGSIYFRKEVVASELDGICTVSNHLFYQELVDWITKEKPHWKLQ